MTITCRIVQRIPVLDGTGRRSVVCVWTLVSRGYHAGAPEIEKERWYRLENGADVEPVAGSQGTYIARLDEGELRLFSGGRAPGAPTEDPFPGGPR